MIDPISSPRHGTLSGSTPLSSAGLPTPPHQLPQPNQPDPSTPIAGSTPCPWWKRHWKPLAATAAVLLLAAAGGLTWAITRPKPTSHVATVTILRPTATPVPTPVTKASPLTGLPVTPELATRPIVAVMVENHPDARPQSGLQDAGVVYEALAEGGITRFQAFFLDGQPKAIGPVRSLRPYYVDWGMEYGAPVAHAGGSADALSLAVTTGMKDLNALVIGAPIFYRTTDRYAPHNLYTSSSLLDTLLARRGYNQAASFTPTPRKPDAPVKAPPHPKIHIDYSYNGYQVDYTYDPATNDYARALAGIAHIDRNTSKQIHVKNVVVEYTTVTPSGDDHGHVNITTTGSGKAILFRDGDAIVCTWTKTSRTSRTKLVDANGAELALNAGNTWYSIVPSTKPVGY